MLLHSAWQVLKPGWLFLMAHQSLRLKCSPQDDQIACLRGDCLSCLLGNDGLLQPGSSWGLLLRSGVQTAQESPGISCVAHLDPGLCVKPASVGVRRIMLDALAGWQTLARNGRRQRAQLQAEQAQQRASRVASLAGSQDGDDLLLRRLYSTSTLPVAALAEEPPVQDDGGAHRSYPPPEMGAEEAQAAEAPQPGLSWRPSSTQAPGRRPAQEVPAERLVARQHSAMQGALAPGSPWAAASLPAGQPSSMEGCPAPGTPWAGRSLPSRQVSRAAAESGGLQSADVNESGYDDAVGEAASPGGDEAAWPLQPEEVSQPQSPRSEAAPARRLAREHSRSDLQPGSSQPGSNAGPGADLEQPVGGFWTSTEGAVRKTQALCGMPSPKTSEAL